MAAAPAAACPAPAPRQTPRLRARPQAGNGGRTLFKSGDTMVTPASPSPALDCPSPMVRPTPADSLSVSLKRAANTFSLLSVSVSVSSNTPHPTPHAVYDTWGPPAGARARERAAERREKAWKWGVWVHAVRFTEPDTESAGARNSASDRAKWGCGVGYGVLLELV